MSIRVQRPLFSVIVPVYNVEAYISSCLESVLGQTVQDFETILVDDGSTDSSSAICDRYSHQESRVRVIHKRNGGLSSARNTGLQLCQGEYVAFLDGDDTVHPQFLELLYAACTRTGSETACGKMCRVEKYEELRADQIPEVVLSTETALAWLAKQDHAGYPLPNACGKLFRRSVVENLRFPEGKIHEDEFVAHLMISASRKVALLDAQLYFHRPNPESITAVHGDGRSFRTDILDAHAERLAYFEKSGRENLAQEQRRSMLGHVLHILNRTSSRTMLLPTDYSWRIRRFALLLSKELITDRHVSMRRKLCLIALVLSPNMYCGQQRLRLVCGRNRDRGT